MAARGRAPTRKIEQELWAQGYETVAGIDEVGRGAWAGPLMVGAAILPRVKRVLGVRDSKMLTEPNREALFDRIADKAETVGQCKARDGLAGFVLDFNSYTAAGAG